MKIRVYSWQPQQLREFINIPIVISRRILPVWVFLVASGELLLLLLLLLLRLVLLLMQTMGVPSAVAGMRWRRGARVRPRRGAIGHHGSVTSLHAQATVLMIPGAIHPLSVLLSFCTCLSVFLSLFASPCPFRHLLSRPVSSFLLLFFLFLAVVVVVLTFDTRRLLLGMRAQLAGLLASLTRSLAEPIDVHREKPGEGI